MDWDAIGALGEIIGAGAVVVSLIYVALQIRQNTVSQQGSTHHQYLNTQTSANRAMSDSAEVCELIDRADKDFSTVTSAEKVRLMYAFFNHFNQWHFAFQSSKKSLMDDVMYKTIIRGYSLVSRSSATFGEMWKICGGVYPEDFQDHVNAALANKET